MKEFFHWVTRVELLFILVGFSYALIAGINVIRKIREKEKHIHQVGGIKNKEGFCPPERPLHNPFWTNCFRRIAMVDDFLWIVGIFGFLLFMIIGIIIIFMKEVF